MDPAQIAAFLAAELGDALDVVFASFELAPVAAASIGQVHRARLHTGEAVAVKIQRPGIERQVRCDLDILRRLARLIERRAGWARTHRLHELIDGFRRAVLEELDFQTEARNISAMAAATCSAFVCIPRVHDELSSARVLVLDWIDGPSVRDACTSADGVGIDLDKASRELLRVFLHQLLHDGLFHADLHPGNVLITPQGKLALIDLGSVGRLSQPQQSALRRMLLAVASRNPSLLCDAVLEIATSWDQQNEAALERGLGRFVADYLRPGSPTHAEMLAALLRLLADFGVTFPPELAGVCRALFTLEGTLGQLSQGFQLFDEVRLLHGEVAGELARDFDPVQVVRDEVQAALPMLRRLPRRIDRISSQLQQGSLTLGLRLFADDRDVRTVRRLMAGVVLVAAGSALTLAGALLVGDPHGPIVLGGSNGVTLAQATGYGLLSLGTLLMLRAAIGALRAERS